LRQLQSETFAPGEEWKKYCRASEWSPETNWITVPSTTAELVAGRVDAPNPVAAAAGVEFVADEPTVELVTKKWDPALQVPVSAAQKVARASVLNFRAPGLLIDPINHSVFELDRELIDGDKEGSGVKFNSQMFVVDLLGGQRMPYSSPEKTYYAPSEMIVMDGNGNLQVRNAREDRMDFRHSLFKDDEALSDIQPKKPVEETGKGGGLDFGPGRARR
jgi:hypothetical protein